MQVEINKMNKLYKAIFSIFVLFYYINVLDLMFFRTGMTLSHFHLTFTICTEIVSVCERFYANPPSFPVSVAKRDSHSSGSHTPTSKHTRTQCHLESERSNSWMIFIVIHVVIYSLVADAEQGCNMQMLVCFSMGIFQSTASICH